MTAKDITPKLEDITPDSLAERAILVGFHKKAWTPTARNVDLESYMRNKKQYDGEATIRQVLIDKTFLTEWNANARAMRQCWMQMTLPWTDRGYRVLMAQKIEDFTNRMAEFKTTAERLAVELQGRWPAIIEHAKTLWPGDLFDETKYPTTDQILELFEVDWSERPVPTAGDFRLANVSDAMRERMQEKLEAAVSASIAIAIEEPWLRLTEAVQRMVETLAGEERFEYTMLTQLAAVAAAMPGLNLTDDPKLTEICGDINGLLKDLGEKAGEVKVSEDDDEASIEKKKAQKVAATIRKDDEAKADAKAKAQAVLDKMAGFMGGSE